MKKSYEIDMCNGGLWGKILMFSFPLMLSGILQLLFNAADIVVVGRFAGSHEMAAVGATGALINLLVNVFIGLSIGTNVLTARFCGAGDKRGVEDTVHTSVLISVISGGILLVMGLLAARPMLEFMGTPEEVLDYAVQYMKIYFMGMPVMLLYNFGAAILRAVGDTKRPLYFLTASGVINVIFNMIFVIVFHLGVKGVALATVISQTIAAVLVVRCLMKTDGVYRLEIRKLAIHKKVLIQMLQVGLPAGIQGAVFSASNVLIQSAMNSFGAIAVAGCTAAGNLEGFVYTSMNAVSQTAMSFTGQNFGAGKYKRIDKIMVCCMMVVTVTGLIVGGLMVLFGKQLLGIYSADPEVVRYGLIRMRIICLPYFLCGIMEVIVGSVRGMGHSVVPMIVALLGACGLRVVWIFTVFAMNHTIEILYLSYPVTWTVTAAVQFCYWMKVRSSAGRARTKVG
ncbi:MAG: MATE family efflux transporter [Candidatus Limivivens sp.]|nr:MATE family efflux transporter [Candidatus Limivivens sp.]